MAKKSPPPARPRTAARAVARLDEKTAEARQKLLLLEPGGSPGRPLEVTSAAVVEARATRVRCPRCEGELRVQEHAAKTLNASGREAPDGVPLRVLSLACFQCGKPQRLFVRITTSLPS
jgi:hypothetical protein